MGNKNVVINTYWIQTYDSIMCGYLWMCGFIDFTLKGKSLLEYTILFLLIIIERMIK